MRPRHGTIALGRVMWQPAVKLADRRGESRLSFIIREDQFNVQISEPGA